MSPSTTCTGLFSAKEPDSLLGARRTRLHFADGNRTDVRARDTCWWPTSEGGERETPSRGREELPTSISAPEAKRRVRCRSAGRGSVIRRCSGLALAYATKSYILLILRVYTGLSTTKRRGSYRAARRRQGEPPPPPPPASPPPPSSSRPREPHGRISHTDEFVIGGGCSSLSPSSRDAATHAVDIHTYRFSYKSLTS